MSAIDLGRIETSPHSSVADPVSSVPADWTDQEFRQAFESLAISNELFRHREHIRLAWIYSTHFLEEEAVARMVQGIRAFADHHGAAKKYHHTVTLAWMQLVRHEVRSSPAGHDFSSFLTANPHLLNPRLLADYYSPERLNSEAARNGWLEPDRCLLP